MPDDITLPQLMLQDAEVYADKVAFVEVVTRKEVTYSDVVRNEDVRQGLELSWPFKRTCGDCCTSKCFRLPLLLWESRLLGVCF